MGESGLLPPQVGPPGVSLHQACLVSYRHDTKLLVGKIFYRYKIRKFYPSFLFGILFDDAVICLLLVCCENVNIVRSVSY